MGSTAVPSYTTWHIERSSSRSQGLLSQKGVELRHMLPRKTYSKSLEFLIEVQPNHQI